MHGRALRAGEGRVERLVVLLGHRAVEVVVAAPAVARGPEGPGEVDRVRLHHRAHRIVEVEVGLPDERGHVMGEGVGGQGARGHDRDRVVGDAKDLLPVEVHLGQRLHRLGDPAREEAAIHRQRAPRRDLHLVGDPDDERVHPPHLLLQEAGRLIEGVAAQAVGAHELGEVGGLVDGRPAHRPHLVEVHAHAPAGQLPGRLAPGEPASDDGDPLRHGNGHYSPRGYGAQAARL